MYKESSMNSDVGGCVSHCLHSVFQSSSSGSCHTSVKVQERWFQDSDHWECVFVCVRACVRV